MKPRPGPAAPAAAKPRREKPTGRLARFAEAKKSNNDLLADCERLLLAESFLPQEQNGGIRRHDVIHPSEMAKSDWCPRATYLRILRARAGTLPELESHRFQTENIFEEGHEYHRKWQDRFRRMRRLYGRWRCEACHAMWEGLPPDECPKCQAYPGAITYAEVGLTDDEHMIRGSADGIVIGVDPLEDETVFIEIKSVGEGTVRMELPAVFRKHSHEIQNKWGGTDTVLDMRGIWKDITMPFGPHIRQGLIYLRMWGQLNDRTSGEKHLSDIKRICFLYEFKPTSMTKAFYVERDDEAVQEIWDSCMDIVHALDKGGRPPRCVEGNRSSCKECQIYEENDDRRSAQASREAQGQPGGRRRTRKA